MLGSRVLLIGIKNIIKMLKFAKIKKKLPEHSKILENFFFLSLTQLFNLIYPLITYPYLIKTLGASVFGLVIFAQAICVYFSIIINWGFEATGTKKISIHRDNKKKLSQIISSILIIKFCLWILCFLFLILLIISIPALQDNKLLYVFTFLLTLNELLVPIWYFQGTEKMKYITYLTIFIRCVFLIAIFIFIHGPEDYLYVPLLNSIGIFGGGALALYLMIIKDKNKFQFQPVNRIIFYIKDGFPIFVSNIVISIKDRFNVLLIGAFLGMTDVAIYDLATKIMNIIMQFVSVANNAIYPRMAQIKNLKLLKKFICISFISVCFLIICIVPFLQWLLNYLSGGLEGTLMPTLILLVSPIIMSISLPLSRNFFLVFGMYKYIIRGAIYTSLIYLFFIALGYISNSLQSIYVFTTITVLTFLFELLYRLFFYYKLRRINR